MSFYSEWYKRPEVKFQMIKHTYNRETAFIMPNFIKERTYESSVRLMRIHNVSHLDIWLRARHVTVTPTGKNLNLYNIYTSLSCYKFGVPRSSLKLEMRKFDDWKMDHWKQIISYNMLIDIDAKSFDEVDDAYNDAKKIKEYFDELNVSYYLHFSGCGFHFILPYSMFKHFNLSFNPKDSKNIYDFYKSIAKDMKEMLSGRIDLKVFDSRRVYKVPFTLSIYDGVLTMCRPFQNEKDFDSFTLEKMMPENQNNIREMTDFLFNPNGDVSRFIEKVEVVKDGND